MLNAKILYIFFKLLPHISENVPFGDRNISLVIEFLFGTDDICFAHLNRPPGNFNIACLALSIQTGCTWRFFLGFFFPSIAGDAPPPVLGTACVMCRERRHVPSSRQQVRGLCHIAGQVCRIERAKRVSRRTRALASGAKQGGGTVCHSAGTRERTVHTQLFPQTLRRPIKRRVMYAYLPLMIVQLEWLI